MLHRFYLRMVLPTILTSIVLLGTGIGAAWRVQVFQESTEALLSRRIAGMRAAEEISLLITDVRYHLNRFAVTGDEEFVDATPKYVSDIGRWLDTAQTLAEGADQTYISSLRSAFIQLQKELAEIAANANRVEARVAAGKTVETTVIVGLFRPARAYLEHQEQMLSAIEQQAKTIADRTALSF